MLPLYNHMTASHDVMLFVQMLPLVKRSCDTLIHKLSEVAASEQSTDLHK